MAIGPVQLVVLGFEHPDFHGEIIAELERLRESDRPDGDPARLQAPQRRDPGGASRPHPVWMNRSWAGFIRLA